MNSLLNHPGAPPSPPGQVIVSIVATETTALTSVTGNSPAGELTVEEALHRQAEAMTDVLTEIMDRPITPRFWGLNE